MFIDEPLTKFKEILDNKKDHRLSKETREELVDIYNNLVKVRNCDTDLKFFDKVRNIDSTMDLYYYLEQLRQCLESEGVEFVIEDLVKVIDIFIRIIGLDRKVTKKDGLFAISSAFHRIYISPDAISDLDGKKLDSVKNAFKKVNDLADDKIENFDKVLSNIKIIYKELAIFLNEAMVVIENAIRFNTNRQVLVYSDLKNMIMIYGVIDKEFNGIRYLLYSSILTHKDPEKTILLTNTIQGFENKK